MFEAVAVADVATRVDPGPRPSVHDLSAALDEAVAIQAQIDALEGRRLLAVERARRVAERCEGQLLDDTDLETGRASAARRRELALRAFTADLATALRTTEQRASHLVDTARTLTSDGVATLAGLCAGRYSGAHATAMADTLADLPDPDARALVEATALPCASTTTLSGFRARLRRARDLAHPEPFSARHEKASARRAVFLDPASDGMAWLSAYLPAVGAHAAYDRLTGVARRAQAGGDTRSLPQLRADTFADLLLTGADGAEPGAGAGRDGTGHRTGVTGSFDAPSSLADLARRITPRVQVTVPVLSLLGHDGAPAELHGQGPVDAETAARLTAAAPSLRRLLVDPVTGDLLSTDPGTYTVPAGLRAALQTRDRTCRFPGCSRPASRSDVDHTVAWADGGRTVASNLAHLCRPHHVVKHQTGWRVLQAPDGTLTWTSPTGRTHRDPVADPVDRTGRGLDGLDDSAGIHGLDGLRVGGSIGEQLPHTTAGPDPAPISDTAPISDAARGPDPDPDPDPGVRPSSGPPRAQGGGPPPF